MKNILYIEDSPELVLMVREALKPHQLTHVTTLRQAELALQQKVFDLILLDLGLPDGDGLHYLAEKYSDQSKNLHKTPLFVISGKNEVSSKVMAFAMGVDDYISKPFHHAELKARVEAKLRKNSAQIVDQETLQIGNIKLDLARQRVILCDHSHDEEELQLTRLQFKLLTKFMKTPERVFSRNQLIESVWGDTTNITDRTVDTHVAHLRKKIAEASVKIETVTGEGYRLVVLPVKNIPLISAAVNL